MENMFKFIKTIDYAKLREQADSLSAMSLFMNEEEQDTVIHILSIVQGFQRAIVDDAIETEETVFHLDEDDKAIAKHYTEKRLKNN